MKSYLIAFFASIISVYPITSFADVSDIENTYFSGKNPILTVQEKEAIAIAKQWNATNDKNIKPVQGNNGAIKFVYGAQQPSIVCAVLQVCDVALQPGEQVNSIDLGDTVRWNVTPAISGVGAGEIQHIIIKPLDVGLETTLIVTTDRRTYHLRLRSHRKEYMPHVAFIYPEDSQAQWEKLKARQRVERQENTIPKTGEYLGDLDFEYDVKGDTDWKPVRVFNDGKKTIIEMPSKMDETEAPTLLVVKKEGGFFTDDETVMVNYRVHGSRYIVDTVFDKAIMIAGVGRKQDRVLITRSK